MIGKTISHYRILEKLGEGGMGVVYKARDTHLDRFAAIKVLPAEKVADPERKRRFVQEAKAASALNHPNIITIYDIDQTDGVDFMAMEYVAGKTLDLQIPRKGLRLNESLRYAVQIADALEAAHAASIIHRDLKPGNVIVSERGAVTVLDFGLAKLIDKHEISDLEKTLQTDGDRHTDEGTILGTVSYMSPEQAEGKKVDARSDIFSFGALLYEMVTGRKAFQGETKLSTLTAILREDPKPPSQIVEDLPAEAERIINRCLRKDPARRWQTMADVRIALQELKEESDSGKLGKVPLPQRGRRPSLAWTAGLLALLAAVAVAVWFYRSTTEVPEAPLTVVPLTSYPGSESQPSFSPDGNQVAFSWEGEKEGNPDIYVKLIGAGRPLRLTSHPDSDTSPAWSPDGRYIAFVRNSAKTGGFYLVPALGSPERKLAEATPERLFLPSLSYSPDGQFLAVADKNSPEEPFSLFLLSVETGVKRPLTSPAGGNRGDYNPVFSPDGKMLAFVRFSSGMANDIYLVPVVGGEPRRLISETNFAYMTGGLAWTPDGREIIFSSDRGASFGLWRVPATGGRPKRVTEVGPNAVEPSISLRGNRLAYRQSTWDTNLWRLELSSSKGGSRAPAKQLVPSTREDDSPHYSPDGQKIVFVSNRSGRFEIWVCEADGSNPVPLTHFGDSSKDDPGSPRWSPDGRYVAFDLFTEGQRDIAVVSAEGDRPRRLTRETSQECIPSWSADGRWVYFSSDRSGSYQIWKAPIQGGEALPVTKGGGYDSLESPDGKFLYYTKGREVPGIWRVPVGGGQEMPVLDHHRAGYWRAWDVVAEGIYFATAEVPSRPVIEFFSFTTGRVTQIAQLEKPIWATTASLTVSPDQRWLVYAEIDQSVSDLMLVENFR